MSDSISIRSILRNYRVHFSDSFQAPLRSLVEEHCFFIVDPVVWDTVSQLGDIIPGDRHLKIEATEFNKSPGKCLEIISLLVERQFRRNDKLVALGGGIIQDITAFSASILYRGVEWIFFPTTLLSQADSCIGSKTSINLGDKKNLIGNFYPPSEIFIDTRFLDSLTREDIQSGIGEIMHYYVYSGDDHLMDELNREYEAIFNNRDRLTKYIRESLRIKKSVIETDEFDKGERNKFNYGHTFGHALESVTDYALKHGQAVTVGMDLANYLSMEMGIMPPDVFTELRRKLLINFPLHTWNNLDYPRYFSLLLQDKKNLGGNIGCILAEKPGRLIKKQLPLDQSFKHLVQKYFSEQMLNR